MPPGNRLATGWTTARGRGRSALAPLTAFAAVTRTAVEAAPALVPRGPELATATGADAEDTGLTGPRQQGGAGEVALRVRQVGRTRLPLGNGAGSELDRSELRLLPVLDSCGVL
jgi:hypothetical protein